MALSASQPVLLAPLGFATTSIVQFHSLIDGLSETQDVVIDVASSLANIERPLAAL